MAAWKGPRTRPRQRTRQRELQVLDAVLYHLPLGIVVLDTEGRVQLFNRYEQQLSGKSASQVLGRAFFDEIAPCTRDIGLKERFFAGIRNRNLALDLDFEFPYPYNTVPRTVRIRAASIETAGLPVHSIFIEDITTRKNLQRSSQDLAVRLRALLARYMGRGYAQELENAPEGEVPEHEEDAVVLFADLTGFTSYASTLSPAELFSRLNLRLRDAVSAVLRYGGVLDKLLGDAVLAYFLPRHAKERAIWDALRAARDIVRAATTVGCALPFRVGVAAGPIMIGTVGSRDFGNVTVLGHTVNLAKRLQEAAQPGEVLISSELCEHAGAALSTTPVVGLALKGMPAVKTAYRMDKLELP